MHVSVVNKNDLFTKKRSKMTKDFRAGKSVVQYHIMVALSNMVNLMQAEVNYYSVPSLDRKSVV